LRPLELLPPRVQLQLQLQLPRQLPLRLRPQTKPPLQVRSQPKLQQQLQPALLQLTYLQCIGNIIGRGQKRKTSVHADRVIQRKIKVDRRKSASTAKVEIESELGIIISEQTVRRRQHESGFMGRVARKKPYVDKLNRGKRIDVWYALSVLHRSFSGNPHLIFTHLDFYCEKNGSHHLACSLTETLLDFEAGGSLPVGYGNFTWTGATILNGATHGPMSGYHVVTCSGSYVIYTFGTITMQKIPTGTTFSLNSFLATAAWLDNLNLTISGRLSSTVIYSTNIILQVFSITVVNLNWSGIDTMTLTTSGGTKNVNVTGSGKHVAIDNMCVTY
ncbi:unnamed protein product, partial [Rotaria magnacalcarata]